MLRNLSYQVFYCCKCCFGRDSWIPFAHLFRITQSCSKNIHNSISVSITSSMGVWANVAHFRNSSRRIIREVSMATCNLWIKIIFLLDEYKNSIWSLTNVRSPHVENNVLKKLKFIVYCDNTSLVQTEGNVIGTNIKKKYKSQLQIFTYKSIYNFSNK